MGGEAGSLTLDSMTLTTRKTLVTSVVTCRGKRNLRSEHVGFYTTSRGERWSREGGHYLPQSRTSASDEKQRSPLASTGSERRRAAEIGGREMTESDPKWSGHVDAC